MICTPGGVPELSVAGAGALGQCAPIIPILVPHDRVELADCRDGIIDGIVKRRSRIYMLTDRGRLMADSFFEIGDAAIQLSNNWRPQSQAQLETTLKEWMKAKIKQIEGRRSVAEVAG